MKTIMYCKIDGEYICGYQLIIEFDAITKKIKENHYLHYNDDRLVLIKQEDHPYREIDELIASRKTLGFEIIKKEV